MVFQCSNTLHQSVSLLDPQTCPSYIYLVGRRGTPDDAQGSLLAQCSGVLLAERPHGVLGITWVSHMQSKCHSCYSITLVPK